MLVDDVMAILVAAGVGTFPNGNMFWSTKAAIPAGNGPFLGAYETGGSGPEGTHNAAFAGSPGYVRPNVMFVVKASSYPAARAMAEAAYLAMLRIGQRSQFVNNVWWVKTTPLQEPNDSLGLEEGTNRAQVSFNFSIEKRLNATL